MKNHVLMLESSYASPHGRLLGGWRDILDDIRHLCTSMGALSDGCACGDAGLHPGESCGCCSAVHSHHITACRECDTLLARLRPEIDTLMVDTIRFFPVVRMLVNHPPLEAVRDESEEVERRIAAVVRTFERLITAADEFMIGCRASHLPAVKETAAELLEDADCLDRHMKNMR